MINSGFHAWGTDHLAVMIGLVLAAAWMIRNIKILRQKPLSPQFRTGAGLFILMLGLTDWVQRWQHGYYLFPLQLCDIALILAAFTWFFSNKHGMGELVIFWTLSGSVQAVLTPDLSEGFPHIPWIFFFGSHVSAILSGIYFLCSGEVSLSRASVRRVSLWTMAYAAAIGLINWHFHFNYGYLSSKPAHASLLDRFGPWPYYILVEGVLAFGLFFVILAFGRWIEKKARH